MQGVGWTNRGDVSVNWCICVLVYLCICYLCVCVFVFLSHGASWQMQGAGWTNRGDVSVNWCAAFSTPDCRLRAPFYPHKPPICEILTSWQIGNDGSTNPTIRKIWQKSNCEIGTIHSFHETEGSGIKLDANNPKTFEDVPAEKVWISQFATIGIEEMLKINFDTYKGKYLHSDSVYMLELSPNKSP